MSADVPADIAIETIFVVEATYGPDAAEIRPRVRPEHLARIAELRDRGVVVEAGGYTDLSTALVLIRADSAEAALAIARDDIYLSSGVWVELRVKPFGRVIRPAELPTATAS
jgi:uncharacterized protein YciI